MNNQGTKYTGVNNNIETDLDYRYQLDNAINLFAIIQVDNINLKFLVQNFRSIDNDI